VKNDSPREKGTEVIYFKKLKSKQFYKIIWEGVLELQEVGIINFESY